MSGNLVSGWELPSFDDRDRRFSARRLDHRRDEDYSMVRLEVDTPIVDQGAIPCCVSICVATCLEYLDVLPATSLSPLFHYYFARRSVSSLGLISIRKGLKTARRKGVCLASLHDVSFSESGAFAKPSMAARSDAKERRLDPRCEPRGFTYERVRSSGRKKAWRQALLNQFPVIAAIWLTESYARLEEGIDTLPSTRGQRSNAGHAVTIVGFDDERADGKGAFLVRDSRGTSFGDGGSWWLPYREVKSRLVDESWVVRYDDLED